MSLMGVGLLSMALLGMCPAPDQHGAGDAIRDGPDHQRAAHGCAHRDVVAMLGTAEQDRDQCHHALGKRSTGGGKDRSHGEAADLQPNPEPFDGVDEPLAGKVDGYGAAKQ